MALKRLTDLKMKLLYGKDFAEITHYFFDHFGENPEFIDLGQRQLRHPMLEAMLPQLARHLFKRDVRITDVLLVRLAEEKFVHGTCLMDGKLASLMYFEDVQVGLLTISDVIAKGQSEFLRFTGKTAHPN